MGAKINDKCNQMAAPFFALIVYPWAPLLMPGCGQAWVGTSLKLYPLKEFDGISSSPDFGGDPFLELFLAVGLLLPPVGSRDSRARFFPFALAWGKTSKQWTVDYISMVKIHGWTGYFVW